MKGSHLIIPNSKYLLKDKTFSFENIYSERGEKTEFPKTLIDRMTYTNTGNDWGWRSNENDYVFNFYHLDVDEEIINNIDNFSSHFSENPFYYLNYFVGGRGSPFEIIGGWFLSLIASYAAGKMLDQLLLKLSGKENAINWAKIESNIGKPGKIIIKLGKDRSGERTLTIENVPEVIEKIDEPEIIRIMKHVKNNSNSLLYTKDGLYETSQGGSNNTNILI